jgi:hypothetical protein
LIPLDFRGIIGLPNTHIVNPFGRYFRKAENVMGRGKKPLLDAQGRKKCANCEEYKDLSDFSPSEGKAYGVNAWCKRCIAQVKNTRYTLERARAEHLRRVYGLTMEEYEQMLTGQNGLCACCGRSETRRVGRKKRSENAPLLHVDHCHTTGRIRGLLCSACNQALGLLEEDPQRIKALLHYVEERVLQSSSNDVKFAGDD